MSFSSRRRNYLLVPHRRDGLIEWMKDMLKHSFVLDALETTGADTFSHFEMLIDEHRAYEESGSDLPSRLRILVPTVGKFFTRLPLRRAFLAYNAKYAITKRRHVCISFNELRHILNLAQILALRGGPNPSNDRSNPSEQSIGSTDEERAVRRWESSPSVLSISNHDAPPELDLDNANGDDKESKTKDKIDFIRERHPLVDQIDISKSASAGGPFEGPKMITFDGDQTLYSDGANFESNPLLANYLYLLLRHGVHIAVVTAAGYEYEAKKYEFRLSGLLAYFQEQRLPPEDCERFYLFGGECNFLLVLGSDYRLHPVKEHGPGGWQTATMHMAETPGNWDEDCVQSLLDVAEKSMQNSMEEQKLRARIIRKKRSVGMIPQPNEQIPREALDEAVLRAQYELEQRERVGLPFCAFNGGRDAWVDVGNKRVGVQVLQSFLGVPADKVLHIGDQFLNTGNDYAARDVCPCVWITDPEETTYILKSILRLAGIKLSEIDDSPRLDLPNGAEKKAGSKEGEHAAVNFGEVDRRTSMIQLMDVFTGEVTTTGKPSAPVAPSKMP